MGFNSRFGLGLGLGDRVMVREDCVVAVGVRVRFL